MPNSGACSLGCHQPPFDADGDWDEHSWLDLEKLSNLESQSMQRDPPRTVGLKFSALSNLKPLIILTILNAELQRFALL